MATLFLKSLQTYLFACTPCITQTHINKLAFALKFLSRDC